MNGDKNTRKEASTFIITVCVLLGVASLLVGAIMFFGLTFKLHSNLGWWFAGGGIGIAAISAIIAVIVYRKSHKNNN